MNVMLVRICCCVWVAAALFGNAAGAPAKRKKFTAKSTAGDFSYYLLTLSWAPDYCALPNVAKDPAAQFDGSGACVHSPQGAVPKAAVVRAYPVRERDGLIWIWPGDAGLADALKTGDEPSIVGHAVVAAATDNRPKLRYPAGKTARRVSKARRYVPATFFDKQIRKLNQLPA